MIKKLMKVTMTLFLALFILAYAGQSIVKAAYGLEYFWVQVLDEDGEEVTSGITMTVMAAGGSSATTIYEYKQTTATTVTNPHTINTSTNNPLGFYYTADTYDLKLADAYGNSVTFSGLGRGDHRVVFQKPFNALGVRDDITLENSEVIDNDTDDTVSIQSNDNNTTLEVLGYEAKDAILSMPADQGDDAWDTWRVVSDASDNSFDIEVETSTTNNYHETRISVGKQTGVTITAYEANDATVVLSADQGDDNGDDWTIESDQATNSLIMSNDTSGSAVAKLTVTTAGNGTFAGTLGATNISASGTLTATGATSLSTATVSGAYGLVLANQTGDETSTPSAVGILTLNSTYELWVSTALTPGGWTKVGSQ